MTYTPATVLVTLEDVFNPEAFYGRGGKRQPERRVEDDPGVAAESNPLASMDALAAVMDVRAAIRGLPAGLVAVMRDYATRPIAEVRALHGPDWPTRLFAACSEAARIANGDH